ncbi:Lar family restriction alleviation protein [Enterobacter asburiae]|uniref:Lar family restriction alleviation protein n=1 Tax=Enterobacter asburiae TaxID=61645 RepID=UPI0021CE1B7C|nr:Lar family restriction alleviation protein [Enterobacter asburiae]MCU6241156.1 Lar family restriction alleviation protein [Enterobacter asburiae]
MSELKPCPFCGGMPTKERIKPHKHFISSMPDYPGAYIVNCDYCEIRMFSHESWKEAEEKWNRRAGDEETNV